VSGTFSGGSQSRGCGRKPARMVNGQRRHILCSDKGNVALLRTQTLCHVTDACYSLSGSIWEVSITPSEKNNPLCLYCWDGGQYVTSLMTEIKPSKNAPFQVLINACSCFLLVHLAVVWVCQFYSVPR
jgi:hypothetical protein